MVNTIGIGAPGGGGAGGDGGDGGLGGAGAGGNGGWSIGVALIGTSVEPSLDITVGGAGVGNDGGSIRAWSGGMCVHSGQRGDTGRDGNAVDVYDAASPPTCP